ncbi:hypothetical protein Tco_0368785 [Tanacetum coccineum]
MESVKKSIGERAQHKMEYERRVNERQIQTTEEKTDTSNALDASSVIIESNGTESKEQDTSSRSGNDAHVDDADIRPIYDGRAKGLEVQTTAEINIFATGQQHTEQPEFNNEGKVDQNAEQCHDIRPLPAKLTDDKTIELSDQSLESENVCLKKIVAQYSLKYRYIVQSYRGRTQSLVAKKKDISENRASRNFDLMITNDAPFLNVQKTFDRSRSSLGLHGNDVCSHQFRPLKFKAGSKSCSLSKQDSYITTRVGITIPPSHSNAEDNRFFQDIFNHKVVRLGINPMIQPELEDLPKDNPKLEIAVLRMKKKCMDKGSKERSPPHNLRQKPGQYICCQNHKLIADIENDIMDPVMQCTTLLSHSGFSQQKLVSFVTEIHTLSIDISLRDC